MCREPHVGTVIRPVTVATGRWQTEDRRDFREREEKVLEQREVYTLQTVDHGQVVVYEGNRPVETAKSGILRVGSHSRYGFGELRVKAVESRPNQCQNSEEKTQITGELTRANQRNRHETVTPQTE